MKRKPHLLCSLVLALLFITSAHADDVDDFVKSVMQQRHIPAASIVVVKDGILIKAGAARLVA